MLKQVTYLLFHTFLWAIVCMSISCKTPIKTPPTKLEEKQLLDNISRVNDTSGPKICLQFIDSISTRVTFSPLSKFKIYNRKHIIFLLYLPDVRLASAYADSMYYLATTDPVIKQDTGFKFNAYLAMADAAFASDQFDVAFRYYNLAREIVSTSSLPCKECSYLFRIGMAYYRSGKYLHAAHLFKQSADKFEYCNNVNFVESFRGQETISNIGISYEKAGMPDSAIFYYDKCLKYIANNKQLYPAPNNYWDIAVAVVMGNIGSAYLQLGKKDSAIYYLNKSILLSTQVNGDMTDRIFNKLKLAFIYIEDDRMPEANKELTYCDSLKSQNLQLGFSNDT